MTAFIALLAVVTDVPSVRAFHARAAALPMLQTDGSSCGRPQQLRPAVSHRPGRVVVVLAVAPDGGIDDEECDFDAMLDMHDECMTHRDMPHTIPTAAMQETGKLERIVQCAEDGDCPVGEMTELIDGTWRG